METNCEVSRWLAVPAATVGAEFSHAPLTAQPLPTFFIVPGRVLSIFMNYRPDLKGPSSSKFLSQPISQELAEGGVIEFGIERNIGDFSAGKVLALIQTVQRRRLEFGNPDHPFPRQRHETVALFNRNSFLRDDIARINSRVDQKYGAAHIFGLLLIQRPERGMGAAVVRRDPRVASQDNSFAGQFPDFLTHPIGRVDDENVRLEFLEPGQRLGIGIIIAVVDSILPRQQSVREFALIEQFLIGGLVSSLIQSKVRNPCKRSRRCAPKPFL